MNALAGLSSAMDGLQRDLEMLATSWTLQNKRENGTVEGQERMKGIVHDPLLGASHA